MVVVTRCQQLPAVCQESANTTPVLVVMVVGRAEQWLSWSILNWLEILTKTTKKWNILAASIFCQQTIWMFWGWIAHSFTHPEMTFFINVWTSWLFSTTIAILHYILKLTDRCSRGCHQLSPESQSPAVWLQRGLREAAWQCVRAIAATISLPVYLTHCHIQ